MQECAFSVNCEIKPCMLDESALIPCLSNKSVIENRQFCSMKFLNVFCESRRAEVYISLEKIVLIQKVEEGGSLIELDGGKDHPVKVALAAEDLVRKINGEDREGIGFRTGR